MSICQDQQSFDDAFKRASDKYKGVDKNTNKWKIILAVLWTILLVWAVSIAMRVSDRDSRTKHIFSALSVPPLYLVANALS